MLRLHPPFAFERDEVSENLARGRRPKFMRNPRIDALDDRRDRRGPRIERVENLAFARAPMRDVLVEFGHRILDAFAMPAVDAPRVWELAAQPVERRLVDAHVAAGWSDDDRSTSDHDVARKQRRFVVEPKHEVIA